MIGKWEYKGNELSVNGGHILLNRKVLNSIEVTTEEGLNLIHQICMLEKYIYKLLGMKD